MIPIELVSGRNPTRGAWPRPVATPGGWSLLALIVVACSQACRGGEAREVPPLADRIDLHIGRGLEEAGLEPAPIAGDAEFLRRVFLDIAGRIPTAGEARAFLADPAADKRARLVDRLLERPEYARHFASVWRKSWLPQTETPTFVGLSDGYEEWLRGELGRGTPYDRLVADQLTASFLPAEPGRPSPPRWFLVAGQFRPENLAANTTRAFLGLNLDCAQCHDHPFARWTRDDFWRTAAFFAPSPMELPIEDTDRTIAASLFTGDDLDWPEARDGTTGRAVLAGWISAEDNPYFARNAVNRVWAHFFGAGLVEPLDDLSEDNQTGHTELLAGLAEGFVDDGFDLRSLIRAIVLSRAYQRTGAVPADGSDASDDLALFARMPVRALSGEQLYDSLLTAAGLPLPPADAGVRSGRGRFAARFRADRAGSAERSVPQALALFNGPLVAELTDPDRSPILRTLADAPFLDDAGRVDALYLATLSRLPDEDERRSLVDYLAGRGRDQGPGRALADVLWALLNGAEFNTNH